MGSLYSCGSKLKHKATTRLTKSKSYVILLDYYTADLEITVLVQNSF